MHRETTKRQAEPHKRIFYQHFNSSFSSSKPAPKPTFQRWQLQQHMLDLQTQNEFVEESVERKEAHNLRISDQRQMCARIITHTHTHFQVYFCCAPAAAIFFMHGCGTFAFYLFTFLRLICCT